MFLSCLGVPVYRGRWTVCTYWYWYQYTWAHLVEPLRHGKAPDLGLQASIMNTGPLSLLMANPIHANACRCTAVDRTGQDARLLTKLGHMLSYST